MPLGLQQTGVPAIEQTPDRGCRLAGIARMLVARLKIVTNEVLIFAVVKIALKGNVLWGF
jgi:hypothetical protein